MEGGLDLIEMWEQMGFVAQAVAYVLVFMSMWATGVALERYYTMGKATKQSKLFAPQIAKHLKDGRVKDAIKVAAYTLLHVRESRSRRGEISFSYNQAGL